MKNVIVMIFTLCSITGYGQGVLFNEDSIFVNGKLCMMCKMSSGNFVISNLNKEKIITGTVRHMGQQVFITQYNFLFTRKQFYNKNINGKNALMLALVENEVIESCTLNEVRLRKFIKKYNQPLPKINN